MYTKQVSVFLENKRGRLAEVTKLLMDEGINLRALSLADGADFGVLRMIVDDRARCLAALKARGLAAQETDVIAVEIEDRPGSLHRIVAVLDAAGLGVEYVYAFLEKKGNHAVGVLKVADAARAVEALKGAGITILPEDIHRNL
jgi:hypothetical protein